MKINRYAKFGEKECQMKCDREVLMSKNGPVIVCNGCERIVMELGSAIKEIKNG
jgi:hypothetical protein